MEDAAQKRLTELQQEYASGQQMMAELDKKQKDLERTLLRISGAIQVLEELLGGEETDEVGESAVEESLTQKTAVLLQST